MEKELIVITGASSGIGKATALLLAKQGHPLLLLARRIEKLQELKLENTLCEKVDVTDRETFRVAIKKAEQKFGATGCLINNAGVMLLGSVEEQNPQEWQKMFDVNLMGVLNGIHLVLKSMIERRHGMIVNVSSVAGRKTFPSHAVYCATKFGVHAMSENIREETAKYGIRMVTIAPGAVETELLSHTTSKEIKDGYESWKKDMGGVLVPEDVARAIWFAYSQPPHVCIREIVLAATGQEP